MARAFQQVSEMREIHTLLVDVSRSGLASKLLLDHTPEVLALYDHFYSICQSIDKEPEIRHSSDGGKRIGKILAWLLMASVRGRQGVPWLGHTLTSRLSQLVGIRGIVKRRTC